MWMGEVEAGSGVTTRREPGAGLLRPIARGGPESSQRSGAVAARFVQSAGLSLIVRTGRVVQRPEARRVCRIRDVREAPYDHPRGRRGRPRKPSPGEGPSDAGTQPRLPEPDQGVRALWEALQLRKEPRPHSVNLAALSEKEVGALRRAEGRAFPRDPSAEALVAWASRAEPRVRNVGRDSVAVLLPLARRLAEALLAGPQAAGQGEGAVPAVTFLGPPLALHELDAALAADLDLLLTRRPSRRACPSAARR
jgi:hypothetical protein